MARRRFFIDRIEGEDAVLGGQEAAHLGRVLRAEPGQQYEISDNQALYLAEIREAGKDRVVFRLIRTLDCAPLPVRVVLCAALVKFDRFEWLVEKATELGVEAIQPVEAARSGQGLFAAAAKRAGRWRKIAREASQQARRLRLPEIRPAVRLADCAPAGLRYVLEEDPGAPPLLAALPPAEQRSPADQVALLVGPEGGWTDAERGRLRAAGWIPVWLGPHILRAETAATAALAVLVNAWLVPPNTPLAESRHASRIE